MSVPILALVPNPRMQATNKPPSILSGEWLGLAAHSAASHTDCGHGGVCGTWTLSLDSELRRNISTVLTVSISGQWELSSKGHPPVKHGGDITEACTKC